MNEQAKDSDFMHILEDGIRDVLNDEKATSEQKLKAIEVGAKVAAIRYKIKGGMDGEKFFD